ncbi:pectin methyl esterase [Mycena metata]|uniref:pectinesterase n=1 Tax=Mycena metata TaxID=1033252 RepID=A0AAD7ILM0_9AGAR|nr:pectin methyl esterase [Mycena metata]
MLLPFALLLLAIPKVFALSRTTPPAGALVVRQTGATAGEFTTVSAALASLTGTAPATIFIFPGTYNDTGTYKENTVTITHNLNAQDNGGNDACATVRATSAAPLLRIYNINIVNSFGQGKQATALSATGNMQGFYGCQITGYQDTLLADGGGGIAFHNCYIEGAVDYIYGSASAWFGECTIASNGGGAITANSRNSATDPTYYVIDSSTITSGTTASLNSVLPNLINPIGYTTLAANATPIFSEFDNTGAGASTAKRVTYTPISAAITHAQVLGASYDSWIDNTF